MGLLTSEDLRAWRSTDRSRTAILNQRCGASPRGEERARRQLWSTDSDGLRLTAFVTNTVGGQIQDLELQYRRRARCEDRIRTAKDTGLTNFPLHGADQNRIWLPIV